jgi:hypothetical protein
MGKKANVGQNALTLFLGMGKMPNIGKLAKAPIMPSDTVPHSQPTFRKPEGS